MPEEDYNGLNFHYVVYWRKKSTTQADDSRWEEVSSACIFVFGRFHGIHTLDFDIELNFTNHDCVWCIFKKIFFCPNKPEKSI